MNKNAPDVVELLIRYELAIKQLYEAFAAAFADRRSFWQALAQDEQRHADCLSALRSGGMLDAWLQQDVTVKPQALLSSIAYVDSQAQRAREGNLAPVQALSIAKDLESALLEKQFSKISASVSPEARSMLMDIAAETDRHRMVVTEALNTERR